MSNLTDITINDGKTTPVAHIFKPAGIDAKGVATFEDRSSGIPAAFPEFSFSLREPLTANGLFKQQTKFVMPVLRSATGANAQGYVATPSISHSNVADLRFSVSSLSTMDERKDFLAYVTNMVNSPSFKDRILNFERDY